MLGAAGSVVEGRVQQAWMRCGTGRWLRLREQSLQNQAIPQRSPSWFGWSLPQAFESAVEMLLLKEYCTIICSVRYLVEVNWMRS